jgi:competence protein ComEC
MIRACLYLLAGNYALQLSSFAFNSDLIRVGFVAFFIAVVVARTRAFLVLVLGAALFYFDVTSIIESRVSDQYVGDSIVARVRIVDFPKQTGPTVALDAEVLDSPQLPRRLRIGWYEPRVLIRLGDIWQLELRVRRPRGASNPGLLDYEAWLLRERIAATGYVVQGRRNQLLQSSVLSPLDAKRQSVVDRLVGLVDEPERAAVLAAVSVGARHLISADQWERYARTGTSHLMAISGLHIGLAASGGYFLAAFLAGILRIRLNQHFLATVFAVAVGVGYVVISGLAVPAQRAGLMIAIAGAVVLRRRQVRPFDLVAAAAVAIVLASPLASMAPGFKLSFAAVLVLLWLARRQHGRQGDGVFRPLLRFVSGLGSMQLMLLFGLLPLTVLIFGRIAIAAPIVNLLAVPVFSVVTVPCVLIGLILDGWAQPIGDKVLFIAAVSLDLVEALISMAAQFSWASMPIAAISGFAWVFIGLPLLWVVMPPGWPGRSLVFPALLALGLYLPARPDAGCADIDVLDVGQGLSIVVTSHSEVVVFDTGPAYRGGGDAAESVLVPFLRRQGIRYVDRLIVSHSDIDHAGGVETLLAGVAVGSVLGGELLNVPGAGLCAAGEGWKDDAIRYSIIHPPQHADYAGNDASCVLLIEIGEQRVLFTGDIEKAAESDLVRAGSLSAVDIVVVPHHGSRTSSSAAFVAALRPSVAIVSAGFGNRWGFPKDDVVSRWRAVGADVLTTAESGAISMRLCRQGGLVSLTRQRISQRRIWHE